MKIAKFGKKYSNLSKLSHKNFSSIANSFKVYTKEDDHLKPDLNPFIISTVTGFLPRRDPVLQLPSKYDALNNLLNKMRWNQPDGSQGLLAHKKLGDAVKNELPEYDVSNETDKMVQLAIYRDYCFLASAYLLEECHHSWLKSKEGYGLGRDHLPRNLAVPFVKISDACGMRPFLEYNSGYALNNYYRKDKSRGEDIDNIDIYRSFINIKSESGFILVHVAINQHSGNLIKAGMNVLKAAEDKNREMFNNSLIEMKDCLIFMNQEFERMYWESNPADYNDFRTFILGITNQPMFPNGVVYEGCFDNKPQFYRGESGANDSVIPFCDNILQITETLPKNPLTEILKDFRSYRPQPHREFLTFTEEAAKKIGVLEYAKQNAESLLHLIDVADQVRAFRHRHWILTNLYIINLSKHPVATGGSPITTWLPNQLLSVIDFIKSNAKLINPSEIRGFLLHSLDAVSRRAEADERIIRKQVEERRKKFNQ